MSEATAVRVRIEGRVQGVWFRAWTVEEARKRELEGWVRNRLDGTVEALFVGPSAAVEEMIRACREGSPASSVTAVHRHPASPGELERPGFHQLPTG